MYYLSGFVDFGVSNTSFWWVTHRPVFLKIKIKKCKKNRAEPIYLTPKRSLWPNSRPWWVQAAAGVRCCWQTSVPIQNTTRADKVKQKSPNMHVARQKDTLCSVISRPKISHKKQKQFFFPPINKKTKRYFFSINTKVNLCLYAHLHVGYGRM